MPCFTVELLGPWLGRRQLLTIGAQALADQGARLRLQLGKVLERRDINTTPAGDKDDVRIRVVHRAPDYPDESLPDLAAALEPYLLDQLERSGICRRNQVYEIAHRFERRHHEHPQIILTVEERPE